jgi:hypothetical protein
MLTEFTIDGGYLAFRQFLKFYSFIHTLILDYRDWPNRPMGVYKLFIRMADSAFPEMAGISCQWRETPYY